MNAARVVDGVGLGTLDEPAQPLGRADVRVREQLGAERETTRERGTTARQPEGDDGDEQHRELEREIERMAIRRTGDVDALRAVVELVDPPQRNAPMQRAVQRVRDDIGQRERGERGERGACTGESPVASSASRGIATT